MKSKRLQLFLALLALSGAFYVVDCLAVLLISGSRPDLAWYERGIYAGGPFGFLVTAAMFVFALAVLLFARNR